MSKLKLYYWNGGNFGDEINVDIWERIFPDIIDFENEYIRGESTDIFIGIGTLLNEQIPDINTKIIFGSGVGYGTPQIDDSWLVMFVRGPLSCEQLNIDKSNFITDPALLLVNYYEKKTIKGRIGFMPHHDSLSSLDWNKLCNQLGLMYLDPTADYNNSLRDLLSCEKVIAEAMHGAIVADAFDIPWCAVSLHGHINTFKWLDWTKSLNVELFINKFPGNVRLIRRNIPEIFNSLKFLFNNFLAKRLIQYVTRKGKWSLSQNGIRKEKISKMESKIEELRLIIKDKNGV